jgi:hypothetical protein
MTNNGGWPNHSTTVSVGRQTPDAFRETWLSEVEPDPVSWEDIIPSITCLDQSHRRQYVAWRGVDVWMRGEDLEQVEGQDYRRYRADSAADRSARHGGQRPETRPRMSTTGYMRMSPQGGRRRTPTPRILNHSNKRKSGQWRGSGARPLSGPAGGPAVCDCPRGRQGGRPHQLRRGDLRPRAFRISSAIGGPAAIWRWKGEPPGGWKCRQSWRRHHLATADRPAPQSAESQRDRWQQMSSNVAPW